MGSFAISYIFILFFIRFHSEPVDCKNIVVSKSNGSDTKGCGSTIQFACKTLRYAVEMAEDNDVILLDGSNSTMKYDFTNTVIDKNLSLAALDTAILPLLTASIKEGERNFILTHTGYFNVSYMNFSRNSYSFTPTDPYFSVDLTSYGSNKLFITDSIIQKGAPMYRVNSWYVEGSIYILRCIFPDDFKCFVPDHRSKNQTSTKVQAIVKDSLFSYLGESAFDWCLHASVFSLINCSIGLNNFIHHGFDTVNIQETTGSISIKDTHDLTIIDSGLIMNLENINHAIIVNNTFIIRYNVFWIPLTFQNVTSCLIKDSIIDIPFPRKGCPVDSLPSFQIHSSEVTFERLTFIMNEKLKYLLDIKTFKFPEKSWIDLSCENKLIFEIGLPADPSDIHISQFDFGCPVNYIPKYVCFPRQNQQYVLYCDAMINNQYTLNRSELSYTILNGYYIQSPPIYQCPLQARCGEGSIFNLEPYWGYINTENGSKVDNSPLEFVTCPEHFCGNIESSNAIETSWQYCQGKRIGRLCGDCPENYIVPVIGSKQCLLMTDCDDGKMFWILWLLLCLFILTVYGFQRTIAKVICYCFEKYFRKKRVQRPIPREIQIENDEIIEEENNIPNNCHGPQENEEDRVCQTPPPQPLVPLPHVDHQRNQQQQLADDHVDAHQLLEEHQQKNSLSGWFVIFISFYQTIYIIRPSRNTTSSSQIFSTINDVFFTLFTGTLDIVSPNITMCPLQTQNADLVEFIKISPWIACISFTIFLIIILTYVVKFKRRQLHGNGYQNLEAAGENGWQERTLSHLQKGVTQMIFIVYIPISMFLLRLLKCVEINGEHYQFIQASNQCYSTTQIVAWIFLIFWSIFFCPALYLATRLLQMKKIAVNEFVIVLIFPLQIVWYLIRIGMRRNDNEQVVNDDKENIYKVMSNPFKRNDENVPIQWLPIILFRAFILAIISTFVLNTEKRVLANTAFSVVLMIKDSVVWPYRSVRLNTLNIMCWCGLFLEILSSFFLVIC
uniref:Uncharacterized protein n=1 Tax=Clytia hemisphaerica TaxID=252671 RepID=A0A7M5XDZ5_9CNID